MAAFGFSDNDADTRLGKLMVAAQGGDQTAYRTLLTDSIPTIKRVARNLGTYPGSVDDVVQDVLVTLHKLLHTFEPGRSFTAWLVAIAKRRTIDVLRRQGRQALREVHAEAEYQGYADPVVAPEAEPLPGTVRRLDDAIGELPAGQREAVQVLALDGHSLAEGEKLTGRSRIALKVNLHRAIRSLRARLGEGAPHG